MSTYCVFYHNDLDGKAAAAVVLTKYPDAQAIPCDYRDADNDSHWRQGIGRDVYVVDFSFSRPNMLRLLEQASSLTWLDHHATLKDAVELKGIAGKRDFAHKGLSGAELTWHYCYPSALIPLALTLIGDYDSWRLKHKDSKRFHEGLKLRETDPSNPFWLTLFDADYWGTMKLVDQIVEEGKTCMAYRDRYCAELRNAYGHVVQFHGHKAYALNVSHFGSAAFGDELNKHALCIAYMHDGAKYTVSLYSKVLDVGAIAKQNGGGGHKGAAGFVCENLFGRFKKA